MAEKKPTKAELAKREREFKIAQKRLADRFDIDSQNAAIDADDAWRRLQQTRTPTAATPRPPSTMQSLYNMFGMRQAPPRAPATPAPAPPVRAVPDEVLRNRALLEQQSQLPAGTRGRDLRLSPTALNTAPTTPRPLSSILPRQTIEQASQYADPDVLRRMAAQRPRDVRMPIPPRGAPPLNPADMTAAQRFAANPAGGIQGRVRGAPVPLPPAPPAGPTLGRRALRMAGPVGVFAEGMLHSPEAQAPTNYPLEEQETFGMPQEDFIAQLAAAGIADPQRTAGMLMQPENPGSMNPILNAALAYRYDPAELDLEGAFERSSVEDFLPQQPQQFSPEQIAAMDADYFDMGGQEPGSMLDRFVAMMDQFGAQADAERYDDRINEAVVRPDLVGPLPDESPGMLEDIPDMLTNYEDYGIISPDDLREQVMLEYMQGQQQGDPRQRQIMGSANEFAANRPEPRMSPQQLDEYMRMIARDESINAGLAGDPFAGYDESLFPEGSQVFVDPVTGATRFEGNQDYIPDAALTGRQSMDNLRLDTEYTSRALRNVGRARGVPSPQEVERSRMLSTLGGEAQGQGYRADQIAEQMNRIRSRLNSQTLTPQELAAGQTQLETLGAELAAARGGAEQARALQLQGSMQPVPPAPEDFELQQLQEAATAQAQAEAVAEQRRALEELRIGGRNQVGARDMQQYTEMFSEMEPSALPPGMSMANADPEIQEAEKSRVNRIQLATTLAASQEGFRTQPALAMEAARLLSTLRGDPKTQTAFMKVLLEASPDELGQLLQELYDDVGGP